MLTHHQMTMCSFHLNEGPYPWQHIYFWGCYTGSYGWLSWYDLPSPSLPTSCHLWTLPPLLCSNSEACLCNLCNCVAVRSRARLIELDVAIMTCLVFVSPSEDERLFPFL